VVNSADSQIQSDGSPPPPKGPLPSPTGSLPSAEGSQSSAEGALTLPDGSPPSPGGAPPAPEGAAVTDKVEQRREMILAAATRHFAERGFHATDVQVLADELGVGKGTIYRTFGNKEDLFLAAVDRVMVLLRAAIDAGRGGISDPLEQITQAVRSYLAFFDTHPEFVELLIQERAVFRDRKEPTYFQHRQRNIGRWQTLYRALIDEGRVRDMPTDTITDVISSAVYGTMFTNYFSGRKKSLEQQAADVMDVVLHGILTAKGRGESPNA
jgi:AcrR family transcriptional regulator